MTLTTFCCCTLFLAFLFQSSAAYFHHLPILHVPLQRRRSIVQKFRLGPHENVGHSRTAVILSSSSNALSCSDSITQQEHKLNVNHKNNVDKNNIFNSIDPAGPSEDLSQLNINESYNYLREDKAGKEEDDDDDDNNNSHNFKVRRVSSSPHIFVFENLLSNEECESLMQLNPDSNSNMKKRHGGGDDDDISDAATLVQMKKASITEGDQDMRSNCEVGWIPNQTIVDGDSDVGGDENLQSSSLPLKLGRLVGNILMTDEAKRNGWCEPLQLVHYNAQGGKFDLHYDGLYRTITIIYYLNGVGNTWFPFASTMPNNDINNEDENPPTNRNEAVALVRGDSLIPGKHGILAAGMNSKIWEEAYNQENVLRVRKGDAIAFYNYNTTPSTNDLSSIERNWRSIHAGLPTTPEEGEKWIANHWIHHLPFRDDWQTLEKVK